MSAGEKEQPCLCPDGAYADASWNNHAAKIAVVRVVAGTVAATHRRDCRLPSSSAAEAAAILWAFELYPSVRVYSDSQQVAKALGAKWVQRENNTLAHRVAAGSNCVALGPVPALKPKKHPRVSRRLRHGINRFAAGRGVAPPSLATTQSTEVTK